MPQLRITVTWHLRAVMHNCYATVTWISYVAVTWQLRGSYVAIMWQLCGSYVAVYVAVMRQSCGPRKSMRSVLQENQCGMCSKKKREHSPALSGTRASASGRRLPPPPPPAPAPAPAPAPRPPRPPPFFPMRSAEWRSPKTGTTGYFAWRIFLATRFRLADWVKPTTHACDWWDCPRVYLVTYTPQA
jgi:hypothetical protein